MLPLFPQQLPFERKAKIDECWKVLKGSETVMNKTLQGKCGLFDF